VKPEPVENDPSTAELRKASEELKKKIADAKARNDMPVDSALGNPKWEKEAADGRHDLPPDDDEN
jgi:hypothetical protein